VKEIASISGAFREHLVAWLGNAENGIQDLFAKVIHANEADVQKLCVGDSANDNAPVCVSKSQLASLLAMTNAGAPGAVSGAPASSAQGSTEDGNSTTLTANNSPTLVVNGNNPVTWQLNTPWQDNLGALFTHAGQSETIYSTSTVDTSATGTTTVDYWALIPSSGHYLHTTRHVVIEGAANDNAAVEAANDNTPLPIMLATGTEATSSAQ